MKKKSFSYPIIFMMIITAFFSFILAFLNYSTASTIDLNRETKVRKILLYVFNITPDMDTPKEIEKTYHKFIEEKELNGMTIYIGKKDSEVIGYAFPIEGNALWGTVKGFAAISNDYNQLLGIDFISHSETPGLGGRISEEWFKEQFRGISLKSPIDKEYVIFKPLSGGNVDAISGATLTSKSVRNFVNSDIYSFIEFVKGGGLDGK